MLVSINTIVAQKEKTFRSIEEAIKTPSKVHKLFLYNQKGYQIKAIASFTNLEELTIYGSHLTQVPYFIKNLKKLNLMGRCFRVVISQIKFGIS